ncbi:MAG TPA: DUF5691 domain-containing protein [Blastocatellia bacterium]|jgi:hypothetical protein
MSLWAEITNTALIGCERKSLSLDFPSGKLGDLLARLDWKDREGALLGAAAIVSLYESAGTLPSKGAQPAPEACDTDNTPRCGERAAIRLAMMLRGEYRRLLPEWLAKTAAAGRRAPEELLPSLLELGRAQEEAPEEILPALGARGRWLAAQNPDWFYAVERLDETLWETGGGAQRRAVLAELRKRDAARARGLLASSWERESPKGRADFLTALENGLSLDDEAFLEAALDDRRKEVRGAAVDLLARLPESALRRRMFERVRPLITFKLNRLRRKTIEIALPEACDEAMQRDGVEPKPYSRDIGEKAWLLQQMLGMIPPKLWSSESGWLISELIEAAKRGDWKNMLLDGWSQAARLCGDVEWAAALLAETYEREQDGRLFQVLPQARQEAFIIELLRKDPSLHTSNPARNYVATCWRQWGEALSRAVIDSLLHHAETDRFKDGWMWSGFMDNIGCRIDPALIPEAISRLTEATKPPAERAPALERFLDFIQFRHEMLKEISQ